MNRQKRKHIRLKEYDYSTSATYFVTLCSLNREHIFSQILAADDDSCISPSVGRADLGTPRIVLLPAGIIVDKYIRLIPEHYPHITLDAYVIMPNHVHMLISMGEHNGSGAPGSARPTDSEIAVTPKTSGVRPTVSVSRVIGVLKRFSNNEAGKKLWQDSFYDHVIRDEADEFARLQYIVNNPYKWSEDKYYC